MSKTKPVIDPKRINADLMSLRLPGMRAHWQELAHQSDHEGWPAMTYTASLVEIEHAVRDQNRKDRHLKQSKLFAGKTLDRFDFSILPMLSKPQVMALATGQDWLVNGENILLFGPPGVGKTHLACGIGHALIEQGYRVLFFRTSDFVQKFQRAQRELSLSSALAKLDKIHLVILDDFVYTSKDDAETNVLFELINTRYERRSLIITANQPFDQWQKVFPEPAMTAAVVDRLCHRCVSFTLNADSYRRREAEQRLQSTKPKSKS